MSNYNRELTNLKSQITTLIEQKNNFLSTIKKLTNNKENIPTKERKHGIIYIYVEKVWIIFL